MEGIDLTTLLAGIWNAPAVVIFRNIIGIATLTWLSVQALPDGFKILGRVTRPVLSVIAGPTITLLLYLTGIVDVPMEMAEEYIGEKGILGAVVRILTVLALGLICTGCAKLFHDWKVGSTPKAAS